MALMTQCGPTLSVQTLHGCGHSERDAASAARGGDIGMKITSTTDLEFPRLQFAIRQGEGKDLPANPEVAALILASAYIREVPEPESEPRRQGPDVLIDREKYPATFGRQTSR
jgi:hypothetical protein